MKFSRQFQLIIGFAVLLHLAASAGHAAPVSFVQLSGNDIQIFEGNLASVDLDAGTSFGLLVLGAPARQHLFTLRSTALPGDGTLEVSSITISGPNAADFAVSSPTANTSLTPGASTGFGISFVPTGDGTRDAVVTIHSNDPVSPSFSFNVEGLGAAAPVSIADLHLIIQASKAKYNATTGDLSVKGKITITNVGTQNSPAGGLQLYYSSEVPVATNPHFYLETAYPSIPAALPGKRPKKYKFSFNMIFPAGNHSLLFRAYPVPGGLDADSTDNFASHVIP